MDEFIKLGGYLVEGQPEVAHDSALSGNGLEDSPLGLSEQVSEANDLVHSNSGTWDGVSAKLDTTAFSDVSGSFLTALPSDLVYTADIADMATTGDINDLVTSIAETYQPKLSFDYNEDSAISAINGSALAGGSYQPSGNYIPYTAIDGNAFKTNSGLKIATFIGSELRTNFINNNFITLQSVNSTLGINNQVILATGSLTLKTKSDSAYVDREKIHKWDSASDYIQNNSAALNEVSAKLDTTAFSTVSGDFYTTANESGFITGAPAGTMNESAFEYDTSNNITAYKGSAIGGITYTTGSI